MGDVSTRYTQLQNLAEKLHDNRIIYLLFGIGDGLSNSSNIISYIIQLFHAGETPVQNQMHMHFWLMTPVGIAVTIIEATFVTVFSMLGSYFEDKRDGTWRSLLARIWPYLRDSIKGVKNAYKAARSVLFIAVVFGAPAFVAGGFLVPLGIIFGLTYLIGRAWNRSMVSTRKDKQRANQELQDWHKFDKDTRIKLLDYNPVLKKIITPLAREAQVSPEDLALTPSQINQNVQRQSRFMRTKAYFSAGYNELMNGLYLYAGIYLLCTLTPPIALILNLFSIFYALSSILRGLYEEYTYQCRLELSAIDTQLSCPSELDMVTSKQLKEDKKQLETLTYGTAVGEAIRNGLSVYSVLTGTLFVTSLFTPIPLGVLMATVSLGLISLGGFISHHLWCAYQLRKNGEAPIPTNAYPDAIEILRSVTAGIRQGPKTILNLILNHVRTSRMAWAAMAAAAALLAVTFAGKALAKGFGKREKTHDNPILPTTNSMFRLGESATPPNTLPLTDDAVFGLLLESPRSPGRDASSPSTRRSSLASST